MPADKAAAAPAHQEVRTRYGKVLDIRPVTSMDEPVLAESSIV